MPLQGKKQQRMGVHTAMEIYSSIARYLQRRKYERISQGRRQRKRVRVVVRIGAKRRSSAWKIVRAVPRLHVKWALCPKKCLMKMRDAYVNLMTSFASSSLFSNSQLPSNSAFLQPLGGISNSDAFEEKMLLEIYRSLSPQAQAQLLISQYGGDLPPKAKMGRPN